MGKEGGLAQLAERMLSMHEVTGSIPVISTFLAQSEVSVHSPASNLSYDVGYKTC